MKGKKRNKWLKCHPIYDFLKNEAEKAAPLRNSHFRENLSSSTESHFMKRIKKNGFFFLLLLSRWMKNVNHKMSIRGAK